MECCGKSTTPGIYICSLSSEGHHAWNRTVVVYLIQELPSIRETYQRPLCCGVDDKKKMKKKKNMMRILTWGRPEKLKDG
jgi:hypothetical protein